MENGFEATLISKTNIANFCNFLSDDAKRISWKSEAKRSKLFKSKFGHMKVLRKWF